MNSWFILLLLLLGVHLFTIIHLVRCHCPPRITSIRRPAIQFYDGTALDAKVIFLGDRVQNAYVSA
jgi:hypothetical protein